MGRKYPQMIYPGGTEFPKMVNDVVEPVGMMINQGNLTATITNYPMASPKTYGKIANVYLSVGASGKDDTNVLSVEGDVLINGESCFTTKPKIAHVSGEDSMHKTTALVGDTGVTMPVINMAANRYSPGDVITGSFTLVRTASPTTEISAPIMVVELDPDC